MSGATTTILAPSVPLAASGPQQQDPVSIRAQLDALASQIAAANGWPGYTSTLPASLIEDMCSTAVSGVALCDSARVAAINSISPYSANAYILNLLGQVYGIPQGQTTNTSVYVVFTGPAGFLIPTGFRVSDGSQQYSVVDGGVIITGGQSQPIYCLAVNPGSWAVPANTVTTIVTSVPSTISLTVNNPLAGTPGSGQETIEEYRAIVMQGGTATCQGTPAMIKTAVGKVPGVIPGLTAVRSVTGGYEIIVAGGDPYAIGAAIYQSVPNLSQIVGSTLQVTAVTLANPGVVTTNLNHGYSNGQVVTFSGMGGMTALNTGNYTVTVISPTQFSIGVNTSGYPAYTGGGVVAPNLRNVTVSINSYPDTYNIPFVIPPQQTVNVGLTWNTSSTSFVSGTVVNQLAQTAIIAYVNALPVGAPINLFALEQQIQNAVANVLPTPLLSRFVWTVTINGVSTAPVPGTGLVYGDPESYMLATTATVSATQG